MNYQFKSNYALIYKGIISDVGLMEHQVKDDFCLNLSNFLTTKFGTNKNTADAIANSLYYRMADKNLFYHNPLHILSGLSFAIQNNISLEPYQQLAFWFHDAIYIPGAKEEQNEFNSVDFATSLLKGIIPAEMTYLVSSAIRATAFHSKPQRVFNSDDFLVLDLDICSFAWDETNFQSAADALAKEFIPVYGEKEYIEGRKQFLKELRNKGTNLFKSDKFKKFEEIAKKNLESCL